MRIDRLIEPARELAAIDAATNREPIRLLLAQAFETVTGLARDGGRDDYGRALVELGEQSVVLRQDDMALDYATMALDVLDAAPLADRARALKLIGVTNRRMGRMEDARAAFTRSLALLQEAGATDEAAATLNNIGLINWRIGCYAEAMECFERTIPMFRSVGDRGGEADALNNMALIHRHWERHAEALGLLQQSLAIVTEIGDTKRQTARLENLGVIFHELGALEKAVEYHYRGLAIARAGGDSRNETTLLDSLGRIHHHLNDLDEASACFERCAELALDMGDQRSMAFALFGLGDICCDRNQHDRAGELYRRGMEVAEGTQEAELAIDSRDRLARLHRVNGRYDLAETSLAEALAIAERIDERRRIPDLLCQLGALATARHDPDEALAHLHRALALIDEAGASETARTCYRELSEAHKLRGDYRSALRYHERYHQTGAAIINEESVRKIRNLQIVHEVERIRQEAELHRLHNVELEEANRHLQRAAALRMEILGITAHDLRNPLIGMRMHMEHLLGSGSDRLHADRFALIHRSVNEMLAAIQNQLNLAALDSGAMTIEREPVDLGLLAADIVALNLIQLEWKEQQVALDASEGVLVAGDRAKLADIIANLLTNAMKYSPRRALIRVTVREAGGMGRISIADQGPGIAGEERGELFTRFKRLSALPTEGEASTGLGLWIARQLVELHGGTIRLDDGDHPGATFTADFPVVAGMQPTKEIG